MYIFYLKKHSYYLSEYQSTINRNLNFKSQFYESNTIINQRSGR